MGKCNERDEREIHRCKKLIKKCEKNKKCDCDAKEKAKSKDPHFHKEDLLWAFFTFKMIQEVIADPATRDRLKELKRSEGDGGQDMLDLRTIQEALNIKKGTINPQSAAANGPPTQGKTAPGAPPPKPGPAKPGSTK